MASSASIVWFRNDLRIADQPALAAALARGAPVLPVYIHAPDEEAAWAPGAASNWWLHQSLAGLDERLRSIGSRLILRQGPALETLRQLARECGADAVFWCRRYEPAVVARDTAIKATLRAEGLEATSFNGNLLVEPWEIRNQSARPFQVFTPFWKALLAKADPAPPTAAPQRIAPALLEGERCFRAPWNRLNSMNAEAVEPSHRRLPCETVTIVNLGHLPGRGGQSRLLHART